MRQKQPHGFGQCFSVITDNKEVITKSSTTLPRWGNWQPTNMAFMQVVYLHQTLGDSVL